MFPIQMLTGKPKSKNFTRKSWSANLEIDKSTPQLLHFDWPVDLEENINGHKKVFKPSNRVLNFFSNDNCKVHCTVLIPTA